MCWETLIVSAGAVDLWGDVPAPGWMARAGVGNINETARMVAANPKHSNIPRRVQNMGFILAFLARSKSIVSLRSFVATSWEVVFVDKDITGNVLLVQRHYQLSLTMISQI